MRAILRPCLLLLLLSSCTGCREPSSFVTLEQHIEAQPLLINLGNRYIGQSSTAQVQLRATGNRGTSVLSVAIDDSAFAVVERPAFVELGTDAAITVRFLPQQVGPEQAWLRITTDVPGTEGIIEVMVQGMGVPAPSCDDNNPCTTDIFELNQELCVHSSRGGDCNDGNACTSNDRCSDSRCVGDVLRCDDGVECTLDICQPTLGCTITPQHQLCPADDDRCTDDVCTANGCDHPRSADGTPCGDYQQCLRIDLCLVGLCTAVDIPDGAPCEDGDPCTSPDACSAQVCVAGAASLTSATVVDETLSYDPTALVDGAPPNGEGLWIVGDRIFVGGPSLVELERVAVFDEDVFVYELRPKRRFRGLAGVQSLLPMTDNSFAFVRRTDDTFEAGITTLPSDDSDPATDRFMNVDAASLVRVNDRSVAVCGGGRLHQLEIEGIALDLDNDDAARWLCGGANSGANNGVVRCRTNDAGSAVCTDIGGLSDSLAVIDLTSNPTVISTDLSEICDAAATGAFRDGNTTFISCGPGRIARLTDAGAVTELALPWPNAVLHDVTHDDPLRPIGVFVDGEVIHIASVAGAIMPLEQMATPEGFTSDTELVVHGAGQWVYAIAPNTMPGLSPLWQRRQAEFVEMEPCPASLGALTPFCGRTFTHRSLGLFTSMVAVNDDHIAIGRGVVARINSDSGVFAVAGNAAFPQLLTAGHNLFHARALRSLLVSPTGYQPLGGAGFVPSPASDGVGLPADVPGVWSFPVVMVTDVDVITMPTSGFTLSAADFSIDHVLVAPAMNGLMGGAIRWRAGEATLVRLSGDDVNGGDLRIDDVMRLPELDDDITRLRSIRSGEQDGVVSFIGPDSGWLFDARSGAVMTTGNLQFQAELVSARSDREHLVVATYQPSLGHVLDSYQLDWDAGLVTLLRTRTLREDDGIDRIKRRVLAMEWPVLVVSDFDAATKRHLVLLVDGDDHNTIIDADVGSEALDATIATDGTITVLRIDGTTTLSPLCIGCADGANCAVICPAVEVDCGGVPPIDSDGDGCFLECP